MTTRMTVQRLARLIAAGDVDAVRTAVRDLPGPARPAPSSGTGRAAGRRCTSPSPTGRPDVVRVLVEAGADLTARTEFNRTPLHVALQLRPELVPLLRELGAAGRRAERGLPRRRRRSSPATSTTAPTRPTGPAASTCCPGPPSAAPRRPPKLLLERGADADTGALHFAAGGARLALVRLLLRRRRRREPARSGHRPHPAARGGRRRPGRRRARDRPGAARRRGRRQRDHPRRRQRARHEPRGRRPPPAQRRRPGDRHDALAELLVAHGATE